MARSRQSFTNIAKVAVHHPVKKKILRNNLNFACKLKIASNKIDRFERRIARHYKLIRQWFSENGVSYYGQQVNASEVQRLSAGNADIATTNKIGDLQREIMDVTSDGHRRYGDCYGHNYRWHKRHSLPAVRRDGSLVQLQPPQPCG